ncbi:MAG: hypothetical protein JWO82_1037, partial [Akkermansiaceae bacterium]|nr:hypothetical protein [Akkermansiaceae bacterium]
MSDFSFSPSHAGRPLRRCLAALALAAAACSLAVPQAVAQPLTQRWLTTYGDPSGSYDEGDIVRNSPDGNVIMAGVSTFGHNQNFSNLANIRTAKYDGATGALIWQARSTGPYGDTVTDMAVDSAGNAIVVGARMDQYDINAHAFYVAKYAAADGSLLWERSFTPRSFFTGVVIDAQDNVIATGVQRTTDYSPVDSDIETCKFNGATGETIWDNVYTGVQFASATTDGAQALTLDANGNVFITGYAANSNWQYPECVVLKLAGDTGTNLWTVNRRIDGASGSSGMDVVVGPDGSPIVAVNTPQGFGGLRVIKFQGTDGTELWVNTQDGPQRDLPAGLVMDSKGDVILTGSTLPNGPFQYDIFTRKIKGTDGTSIWTQVFDGGFTKDDEGVAIALDPNDNPVVSGYSSPQEPYGPDNMILKYSGVDGTPLLQQRVAVSEDSDNPKNRHGLAVGPGHITVTGFVYPYPNPNGDPGNAYLFRLNDPAPATVAPAAASDVTSRAATLNATVNPNGGVVTVHFDYGTAPDDLSSTTTIQALTSNFLSQAVTAPLSGLTPDTKYYYRISGATTGGGTQTGEVLNFTTQGESVLLASLSVSGLDLTPVFDSATASYAVSVPSTLSSVTVTATPQSSSATVQVNGVTVVAGQPSDPIPVGGTSGTITIVVSGSGKTQTYTVTTLPQDFVFNSAGDVPVSSAGLPPGDFPATVTLGFTPAPGTSLTMVRNTGLSFDAASFGGLTQGQVVTLAYGG